MFFHVRIEQKSQKSSDETRVDMTEEQLRERILHPYELGEPIIINGKTILPSDINRVRISKSEQPSQALIESIKDADRRSSVVVLGGPSYEWRAADKAEDITDTLITGPPGYRRGTGQKKSDARTAQGSRKKVFVVHGHDHALKGDLEIFLREIGLEPVVLHRQADEGLTVIEKFERHSDVGFAFVILTPDDIAYEASQTEMDESRRKLEYRARQNVIFEFGYFAGKLGRANVCCIYKEGVTLPSDLSGLLYKKVTSSIEDIGYGLIKELKTAGFDLAMSR